MASCQPDNPELVEVFPTQGKHNATIILLHGAGDSGPGFSSWIESRIAPSGFEFKFPRIKLLFPTAPLRPYSACGGETIHIWHDWDDINKSIKENIVSINAGAEQIVSLIQDEIKQGISMQHIAIGGLSMGGMMALHLAYRIIPDVHAVFALSTYLNDNSAVFEALSRNPKPIPLFMTHGTSDRVIPCQWGKETFDQLKKQGVNGTFKTYQNMGHDMCLQELKDLNAWISSIFPDL